MDTTNSQKKSKPDSTKTKRETTHIQDSSDEITDSKTRCHNDDCESHMDRSFDMVARVRAAKEAAQQKMEEFGDVSEYTVTKIYGKKKESPAPGTQASLDFPPANANEPRKGEQ